MFFVVGNYTDDNKNNKDLLSSIEWQSTQRQQYYNGSSFVSEVSTNIQTNKQTYKKRTNKQTDKLTNIQTKKEQTNKQTNKQTNERTNKHIII